MFIVVVMPSLPDVVRPHAYNSLGKTGLGHVPAFWFSKASDNVQTPGAVPPSPSTGGVIVGGVLLSTRPGYF
jgi:hypothetical protein